MREYESDYTQKLNEELKQLTVDQAILKAVADARIDLEGLPPEEVYSLVLERIERSRSVLRTG